MKDTVTTYDIKAGKSPEDIVGKEAFHLKIA